MYRLRLPFLIRWSGEPIPNLSTLVNPIRVPFRIAVGDRSVGLPPPRGSESHAVDWLVPTWSESGLSE